MIEIGFHASHEQYAPSALMRYLKFAQESGFDCAMCSDHFHPWSTRNGQSGFAWAWLGAALEATNFSFGTVCAPGQRYHPAVIAQAAATLAEMYPGRLWLAVGSGEALNESITGTAWPDKKRRNQRLFECAEIMRKLWRGERVTFEGEVHVKNAKLYTLPKEPPLLFGAAITTETAEWLGGWADGLITVSGDHENMSPTVEAFRRAGGKAKPMFLQVGLSYARTDEQALDRAFMQWRHAGSAESLYDIETPEEMDRALENIRLEDVRAALRISADLEEHTSLLKQDLELGFTRLYLNNVGKEMETFIKDFSKNVLPRLR